MEKGTFGKRIRATRKKVGMSVPELAEKISVATKTIYGWENDISMPDYPTLPLLREALGISLDELFGLDDGGIVMSKDERKLIEAYREQPDMQRSVLRLLSIEDKE